MIIATMTSPIWARRSRISLRRCLGSSIVSCRVRRRIAQLRRSVRRLPAPPAVLPEILLRCAAHPFLQRLREAEDYAVHVTFAIARIDDRDLLEAHEIAPVRLAERGGEYDGRTEAQRKYRCAAGRFGGTPE